MELDERFSAEFIKDETDSIEQIIYDEDGFESKVCYLRHVIIFDDQTMKINISQGRGDRLEQNYYPRNEKFVEITNGFSIDICEKPAELTQTDFLGN